MNNWVVVALFVSLAACTADAGETDTDVASTGGTSPASTSGTTAETTPTTTEATGGNNSECDPTLQDCPEGAKCTAQLELPGIGWNKNVCLPEPANGGLAGDPCEVEGADIFTGVDNCAKGYICLNTDGEGKNGACVEFCQPDLKSCPNTTGGSGICNPANEGILPICLATCDPLVQDCPGQQACYGNPEGLPFICFGPDPQDGGEDGSTCEYTNACLAGLQCQDSATLEGCPADSSGCCTPFCPLDGDACTGAEECVAFFAEVFPGFENVGVCVLPG